MSTPRGRESDPRSERRQAVLRDLEELAQQVADGEIDEEAAAGLRAGYEAELEELGKPTPAAAPAEPPPAPARATRRAKDRPERSVNWVWVGTGLMLAIFTVVIIAAGQSASPDAAPGATNQGTDAPLGGVESCEELAALVDSHPGNVIRLQAADCYLQFGDAMNAIGLYQAVFANDPSPEESSEASFRLGLLNFEIGRNDEGVALLEDAVATNPQNYSAKYFLGLVLLRDLGDAERALPLLEEVAALPDLPPDVVASLEGAIATARAQQGQAEGGG